MKGLQMSEGDAGEIVIRGITTEGRVFRPSDWAERLAGALSTMGTDNRMHYSTHAQPVYRSGLRCVAIANTLAEKSPEVYKFLMDFARENRLDVVEGRRTPRK
jgi:hypothetical protein